MSTTTRCHVVWHNHTTGEKGASTPVSRCEAEDWVREASRTMQDCTHWIEPVEDEAPTRGQEPSVPTFCA